MDYLVDTSFVKVIDTWSESNTMTVTVELALELFK
jgi:hypothetical protein